MTIFSSVFRNKQQSRYAGIAKLAVCLALTSTAFASDLALYSSGDITAGAGSTVYAASIHSKQNVTFAGVLYGNLYSNGSVTVKSTAHIYSDLLTSVSQTVENGAIIDGNRKNCVALPSFSIPVKTVTTGSSNITVSGTTTLSAGSYYNVTVGSNAILYLNSGTYNFNKLKLSSSAKVLVNKSDNQTTQINIKDTFAMGSYSKISLYNSMNINSLSVYAHTSAATTINSYAVLEGLYDLPNAELIMNNYAEITGLARAKKITIGQYCKIRGINYYDSDNDKVPDAVEYAAKTDPRSAYSKPAVLVSGSWYNTTEYRSQVQVYDFSHFSGYENRKSVRLYLPQGSVTGSLSLIYMVKTMPVSRKGDYVSDRGMITMAGGSVCKSCAAKSVTVTDDFKGLPKEELRLYETDASGNIIGNPIEITKVTYSSVYGNTETGKNYKVLRLENTYRVSKDFTADNSAKKDYRYLNDAFKAISDLAASNGGKCPKSIVYVATTLKDLGIYNPDEGGGGFILSFRH